MNRRSVILIVVLTIIFGMIAGCGVKSPEPAAAPAAVKETALVQPSITPEPVKEQKPTEIPTSTGPVLGPDGKPVLFPNDVPAPIPDDLKPYNLTFYGYQMSAMQKFVPRSVFKDIEKYSEKDRENARQAIQYILDSISVQEKAQGKQVNENVYMWHLLAQIHAHKYYDTHQDADLEKSLEYYEKCRAKKYAASIADHQELLLFAGRELPEEWK